ncbi:AsmA-like C-terminal region [Pseudarcicella hirudinis]|uniref:AsmA-like C-terminal region n=1 Tax=Pseudarcicella hirudinis TaxID=1079859 RepID=A0A1I5V3F6_9BACT|nr:AsmA-like C-terminal region-containing protein [Pseudarcicella hirudinis]SFQ01496.1 AsmA-like C-terminal region [Pseudarcicella hirudinis]
MIRKVFKIITICLLGVFLTLAAAGIWVYRNKELVFVKVKEIVNRQINGKLEVRDYNFTPLRNGIGFTFSLFDIKLQDSLFKKHQTNLFEAEQVNITLDTRFIFLRKLIVRSLNVSNARLNIFTGKDGYTNLSVFSGKHEDSAEEKDQQNPDFIESVSLITFENFQIHQIDSSSQKYFGTSFHKLSNTVTRKGTAWQLKMDGHSRFSGMVFNAENGAFLKDQETRLNLSLAFDDKDRKLIVDPSSLEIESGDKIGITGLVDFNPAAEKIKLNFETNKLELTTALKLLPKNLQKSIGDIGINPKVTANVHLNGSLKGGTPNLDIDFLAQSFHYKLPLGFFHNLDTKGSYSNHVDPEKPVSDANSRIIANGISGFFETFPVKGDLVINDLLFPKAFIKGKLRADTSSLNALFDPTRYSVKEGHAEMTFQYKGNLSEMFNMKTNKLNGSFKGNVLFKDIGVNYIPQKIRIGKLNGLIVFDEKLIVIPDLNFLDGQNKLFVNGKVEGLCPYLFKDDEILKAFVNIRIPEWKLNWVEVLLNSNKTKVVDKPKNTKFKLSEVLDKAVSNIRIEASLQSDHLEYFKLSARDVRGKMNLTSKKIELENFSLKACGGAVNISGGIDHLDANGNPELHAEGKLINTDVHSVFGAFNNFGQKAITDKNIRGKLSSEFKFRAKLRRDVSLIQNSMDGKLFIDLNNAEIVSFEPFLKMKKIIFKKRKWEEVRFAPIRNNFVLKGGEIEIKPMQIESNVLTFFLEGIYSFGDKTDLSIQIPLMNLKKRDSTYQFSSYNPEKIGANIFLRAKQENGEVNIKLDLLKKFRKK